MKGIYDFAFFGIRLIELQNDTRIRLSMISREPKQAQSTCSIASTLVSLAGR